MNDSNRIGIFEAVSGRRGQGLEICVFLGLLSCLGAFHCHGQSVQIGTATVPAGSSGNVAITLANIPTNLSAFALYITNAPVLGLPTTATGSAQSNLVALVDNFSNGVFRATGFITNDPPVGSGVVLQLTYNIPSNVAPGTYPLLFTQMLPLGAPSGPNPEMRSLVTSDLIPSSGANGAVIVTPPSQDIGLRAHDGFSIIKIAAEPYGSLTSPFRINRNGTNYGVLLVATNDPGASRIRIQTASGIKSFQKLP